MDIANIHASILLRIDKVGSYSTANLIPGEIDDFINEAQRDYINQYRNLLREYSQIPQGVEAHENLRTLVETETVSSNQSSNISNGFEIDLGSLSNNYDYYISGRSYFQTPDHYKSHRIVNKAFINKRSENLDNKNPIYSDTPVVINDGNLIGLYGSRDKEIPSTVTIDYLREPKDVLYDPDNLSNNVDLELPSDTHRDIVDLAYKYIIQSLSGQQQQSQQNRGGE